MIETVGFIILTFLLFTVGMGLIGLAFVAAVRDAVERGNLIEKYK